MGFEYLMNMKKYIVLSNKNRSILFIISFHEFTELKRLLTSLP